jgi:glutathione S-transferase
MVAPEQPGFYSVAAMTRLYTFWVSHFSEKVRWALDFEGVPFDDKKLMPGPHVLEIRKHSKVQTVPLLLHNSEAVQGSGAILDAIPRLFGRRRLQPWLVEGAVDDTLRSRATQLEALADENFGRALQGIAYDILLRNKSHLIELWNYRGPWWGAGFYTLAFPRLKQFVRKTYCGDQTQVENSRFAFVTAFDEMDRLLAHQDYLLGSSPTRADVTVAALLSPLVQPPEHPMKWPALPGELQGFARGFEGRPTWDFVKRMYRDHRAARSST